MFSKMSKCDIKNWNWTDRQSWKGGGNSDFQPKGQILGGTSPETGVVEVLISLIRKRGRDILIFKCNDSNIGFHLRLPTKLRDRGWGEGLVSKGGKRNFTKEPRTDFHQKYVKSATGFVQKDQTLSRITAFSFSSKVLYWSLLKLDRPRWREGWGSCCLHSWRGRCARLFWNYEHWYCSRLSLGHNKQLPAHSIKSHPTQI